MYQRIVVPLDGSDIAELAIPEAERMARLTAAPMHLIRVVDPTQLPWYGAYGDAMGYTVAQGALGDEEQSSDAYLAGIAKRIKELGIEVECEVRHGRAAKELVAAAKPGDIIVIASHGRGGISRWLLGSVAEELIRHAAVPVLLVKATKVVPVTDTQAEADITIEREAVATAFRGTGTISYPNGPWARI
jgi:nucleotide-binding universal stress UspA family protein